MIEQLGLSLLRRFDPEIAHGLALRALRAGLGGGRGAVTSARLKTSFAGLDLPNPIGVAAGFDKNAIAVDQTLRTGFGFCEVGAVTPQPQEGNPRPRLFRLAQDRAAINRFGFNNLGMEVIVANLEAHRRDGVVGVNLGANKDTEDKAKDYVAVLQKFAELVDFATVNVSSPNTEKLRDLQGRDALQRLLAEVLAARDRLVRRIPVLLKIAPDLEDKDLVDISDVCVAECVDGIVATNTTLARVGLKAPARMETGGLSGAPLFDKSTAVLRRLFVLTEGKIPLIGAGGVATAEQAYAKIRAGASVVQLYTAMIYDGVSLGSRIAEGLDRLLAADGHIDVTHAVGAGVEESRDAIVA
ncbi:MAG: quinone-dependent dihydroorotate dehydrogenase [Pseudomonadota bacterium]